jgi:hypothetical protein
VVFLTGSNFLNGLNGNLGDSFGDLNVEFKVGGKSYSGTVVPGLSSSLGDNRYKVAVKAPISVPLGESEIKLSRQQKERFGPGPLDSDVVKRSSFEDLQLEPVFSDLVLVAQRSSDKIRVIDALSSVSTPASPQQKPPKDVSVGMPSVMDRPGQLAVTSNATRAYVPLERSGRVAVVDLLARREVDADASTPAVDDINLPTGASPGAISIGPGDNYAYIADSGRGRIYVLDIYPNSASYNQVVETISVDATSGLRQIAISSDGRKLFATATEGYIYAVNINPEDQPSVPNSNPRKWREQIGKVLTPTGAWGLAATPDPLKMVFTNGNPNTDGSGFGVLTVSADPLNLAPTTRYTNLTLTNNNNVFEVNEGVAVTVTKDGRYAFVAGRNSKNILKVDADPLAGGNIGIIKDPLGPNPQLVAATEPMPEILTNNVALSSDGKYLIGTYPTLGGGGNAYVFNVEEIIKTVENPGGYDLTKVPVEQANKKIVSHIFESGANPLGLVVAQNFEETLLRQLEQFERLLSDPNNTQQINDFRERLIRQIQPRFPTIARILRGFVNTGNWAVADAEIIALLNRAVDRYRFDSSRIDGSGPHDVRTAIPEDEEIHLIFRGVAGAARWAWFARLVGLGNLNNLPNASRHMNHYLDNLGKPLTIDMNEFMKVPSVQKTVDAAVEDAKKAIAQYRKSNKNIPANTLISRPPRSERIRKDESRDWFFAVGDYRYWWQADPSTGEITVQIRD